MANDLLNAAIRDSGLDIFQIAEPRGSITNRPAMARRPRPVPPLPPETRRALGVDEAELWPETGRSRGRAALEEIVAAPPAAATPTRRTGARCSISRRAGRPARLLARTVTTAKSIIKRWPPKPRADARSASASPTPAARP